MKTKIIAGSLAVFFSALFAVPDIQAKTLPPIIISEIQITGGSKTTKDEFVELYNPGAQPINISGWELRRKTKSDASPAGKELFHKFMPVDCEKPAADALTDTVPANGHLLWTNKDGTASFTDLFDVRSGNKTSPSLAENNGLALFDGEGVLIDGITWDICPTGNSGADCFPKENAFVSPSAYMEKSPVKWNAIVRDIVSDTWSIASSTTPETAGEKICPLPTDPTESSKAPIAIRLNEILPNPKAKSDAGEFIELYNFGTEPADISGWILRDATKTGKYIFPPGTIIAAAAYFVITDQSFKLSINNSNETIALFDSSNTFIDSVQYTATKEDVSLNYTATGWPASNAVSVASAGWRGGTPTPGAANILNTLPETKEKVPKKGFKGMPITFSATGKDADGDTLQYTWDFGDGHKSYKAAPSHRYETNGIYAITLKTTDGSDDVLETFTIEIQSYKPPNVRITSLMPNPAGNDTDNEWIIIENRGKKEVNLKGFGIATGWKSLSNHPVREDFVIAPKKEARLTRVHSLFTLPNQKGKIELRAPDGKVLQKIRYKLDTSIAEGIVYKKKKGERWSFEASAEPDQDNETESEPVSSDSAEESAAEGTVPETDTLPTEEAPNLQETEGAVLGASTTAETQAYRYARNRQWMKLINFGTRAGLPDDILFTPGDGGDFTAAQASKRPAESVPRQVWSAVNASLNGLLNDIR